MPKLSFSVRIAATSLLSLSLLHVLFWAVMAVAARALHRSYPDTLFFPVSCAFSAVGLFGIFVSVELLRTRSWARIAALVLAALVAVFCAIGVLAALLFLSGNTAAALGIAIDAESGGYLVGIGFLYFLVFCIALWWIYLFSRSSVATQFSESHASATVNIRKKEACPPPIALLAWLMIFSSALSAISWPLILGRIPAMLFTHVFSAQTSKWIWAANILLFTACGIGLLRLQRWSYSATIALHAFWLVSLLFTQLSPTYNQYLNRCLNALELSQTYPALTHLRFPQWLSAPITAIPTALLIAGLFYYRRAFLKAAAEASL